MDRDAIEIKPFPKELQTLCGKVEVDPGVWKVLFQKATDNKIWAEAHKYAENPDDWPASGMSISMLKNRLRQSVYEATVDTYSYLYYRAHAKIRFYPLDPAAARDWEKWSRGEQQEEVR